jgi:Flp pilus assembly protein TadD
MGFASERQPKRRQRLVPLILTLVVLVLGWFAWGTYTSDEPQTLSTHRAPSAPVKAPSAATPEAPPKPATPRPETAAAPVAREPLVRPGTAASRPPRGATVDPFALALYYQRLGDFENALIHYRAVLEANELNAQAHNNLGLLDREKGLLADSIKEFQRALAIDPRYATARNNLGVALMGAKRVDEARAHLSQVLAEEPRHVDALINLALLDKSAGKIELALESLVRATVIDPRGGAAHYNLAVLYEETGDTGRAIDHYRAFLARAGNQPSTRSAEVRARLAQLEKVS